VPGTQAPVPSPSFRHHIPDLAAIIETRRRRSVANADEATRSDTTSFRTS
jgi:hypothetical protein